RRGVAAEAAGRARGVAAAAAGGRDAAARRRAVPVRAPRRGGAAARSAAGTGRLPVPGAGGARPRQPRGGPTGPAGRPQGDAAADRSDHHDRTLGGARPDRSVGGRCRSVAEAEVKPHGEGEALMDDPTIADRGEEEYAALLEAWDEAQAAGRPPPADTPLALRERLQRDLAFLRLLGPTRRETPLTETSATAATQVPGYEILGELGRGGMG